MTFGKEKPLLDLLQYCPLRRVALAKKKIAVQLCQILDLGQVNWKISSHKEALVSFTDYLPRLESRTFFGIEKPLLELL